jgi:hypothetical protein
MARIQLPNEAFGTFIKAANTWLGRTLDAKSGLEVRLANKADKLHLSVGADSNYIEALLTVDPKDIEALKEPLFLDVAILSAYGFDTDGLSMVVPETEKDDQRITFSVPGFNFRVPRKKGEMWRKNQFDLKSENVTGLVLDKDGFATLLKNLELPDSFKLSKRKEDPLQFCFEVNPGVGYRVHGYDGIGALCHTFTDPNTKGREGQMIFLEDFFAPCKAFSTPITVSLDVTDNQCLGEFISDSSGIEVLRWTQPRFQRKTSAIPKALDDLRKSNVISFSFHPKEFGVRVAKACMLLAPTEMREIPIELHIVGKQYQLIVKKSTGDGEVRVDGDLSEPPDNGKNLEVNLHAACMKDYIALFEPKDVKMEIMKNNTAIISQVLESKELIYWMPILPRSGSN